MEARSEQINDIYFSLCKDFLLGVIGSHLFQAKEIYITIGQKTGYFEVDAANLLILNLLYFTCDPL